MNFKPKVEEIMEEKRQQGLKEELTFKDMLMYRGIEGACEAIAEEILKHGPFDGVLGFSQGCTMFRLFNAYTT